MFLPSDAASKELIKAEIAAEFSINFDHAHVSGSVNVRSNLINLLVSWASVLISASVSSCLSLPRKKCFNLLTFSVFTLFLSILIFATLLLISMIDAGPMYVGANFLFFPRNSDCM